MKTPKCAWLSCGGDWSDIVSVIKSTKNPKERLQKFHDILDKENVSFDDISEVWCVLDERDIEACTDDWLYDDGMEENKEQIYWFFNIYTGEALHIKYVMYCSGIIND